DELGSIVASLVRPVSGPVEPVWAVKPVSLTGRTGASRTRNSAFVCIGLRMLKYFFRNIIARCLLSQIVCLFILFPRNMFNNKFIEERNNIKPFIKIRI